MLKKLWDEYKGYVVSLASILAFIIAMWIFKIPCPIRYLTGISCVGCGMSRAMLSALTLDFGAAFQYHPLWITVLPIILATVILSVKGKRSVANTVLICAAGLFLVTWIIRLTVGDQIVTFDLDSSLISRGLRLASALFNDK